MAGQMAAELIGHPSDTALVLAQLATAHAIIALVERLDGLTDSAPGAEPALRVYSVTT